MSFFPHFRIYKRSKHPALILGNARIKKSKDSYLYQKTSHSEGVTNKGYKKIFPNPNPRDKEPMYVENKKRVDFKEKFGPKLPWKYNKDDET